MSSSSIATQVVGLLSSLSKLSRRINDIQEDFQVVRGEIDQLISEINDLTMIMYRLDERADYLMFPASWADDFGSLLQNLDSALVEIELYLVAAQEKKHRSISWALKGRKKCIRLCRGIEVYRATLNILLTVSSVIDRDELQDGLDEILSSVNIVRVRATSTGDSYVLLRLLEDISQTIYEASPTTAEIQAESSHGASTTSRASNSTGKEALGVHLLSDAKLEGETDANLTNNEALPVEPPSGKASFIFRWAHPAEEVYVTGTFDDWWKTELLIKIGDVFEKKVFLPSTTEKIYYKFVVNGNWVTDHTAPQEEDPLGNLNNVLTPEMISTGH